MATPSYRNGVQRETIKNIGAVLVSSCDLSDCFFIRYGILEALAFLHMQDREIEDHRLLAEGLAPPEASDLTEARQRTLAKAAKKLQVAQMKELQIQVAIHCSYLRH